MEQFKLEKYLENPRKRIVTRDGRNARVICVNRINNNYPIVALIRNNKDCESLMSYTEEGKLYKEQNDSCDLFFASRKKGERWINISHNFASKKKGKRWINIFRNSDSVQLVGENAYKTKEEAKGAVYFLPNVATVKIEWEE